jgi:hypothetical protein
MRPEQKGKFRLPNLGIEGKSLPQCQAVQGKNKKVARQANQDQAIKVHR